MSKASYVYILSGQKLIKNAKWSILARFWKPEACGQTALPDRSLSIRQKLVENAKIEKLKCDNWVIFRQCAQYWKIPQNVNVWLFLPFWRKNSNVFGQSRETKKKDSNETFYLIFKHCEFIHACRQPDLLNEILDDPLLRDLRWNWRIMTTSSNNV